MDNVLPLRTKFSISGPFKRLFLFGHLMPPTRAGALEKYRKLDAVENFDIVHHPLKAFIIVLLDVALER